MTGLALPARRRSRSLPCRILTVLALLALAPSAAAAQEPLFLRIRPISDAEAARAAGRRCGRGVRPMRGR